MPVYVDRVVESDRVVATVKEVPVDRIVMTEKPVLVEKVIEVEKIIQVLSSICDKLCVTNADCGRGCWHVRVMVAIGCRKTRPKSRTHSASALN